MVTKTLCTLQTMQYYRCLTDMDSLKADVNVESRVVENLYKADINYITLFCLKITCCTKFVFILHNILNNLNDCYDF